jgi:AcrR family transcriptional regulator
MGRPRSFDDATVLDAAVDVFRREGFSRASVARLERATGLSTSSLYHAFGGKEALFERAVDHYVATFVTPRLEAFAGPTARLEDVEQLFLSLSNRLSTTGFGCLVINSALELGGDRAVAGWSRASAPSPTISTPFSCGRPATRTTRLRSRCSTRACSCSCAPASPHIGTATR